MARIVRPSVGIWTPGKLLKQATAKLYEQLHGYRAPHWVKMGGRLSARALYRNGRVDDHGVISVNSVTTEFVEYVVDNLVAEVSAFGDFKYHVSGTGSGAEAVGDDASTFTSPDGNPLDTGTQVEGATAEIYKTVATIAYTGTKAVTEHGILNNSTLLSGILMDRSQFTAINVGNGDSIEFTYELTVNDGG